MNLPVLVCTGREHDRDGRPVGEPCGRTYHRPCWACQAPDAARHTQAIEQSARAAGWRLGPTHPDGTRHAMCPTCSRPDPATTAICRDIQKGLTRP